MNFTPLPNKKRPTSDDDSIGRVVIDALVVAFEDYPPDLLVVHPVTDKLIVRTYVCFTPIEDGDSMPAYELSLREFFFDEIDDDTNRDGTIDDEGRSRWLDVSQALRALAVDIEKHLDMRRP